ncbi:hypothetical protein RRG08_064844 [Elysia crispata]|uniref:Uncharacterized protein n=1 Tax=Elysia crispata TaxID=231223 RepID=A0AAE1E392_9GAST|nr:hypothetical protein RRG08_064844 [Elysia crispata]
MSADHGARLLWLLFESQCCPSCDKEGHVFILFSEALGTRRGMSSAEPVSVTQQLENGELPSTGRLVTVRIVLRADVFITVLFSARSVGQQCGYQHLQLNSGYRHCVTS